jgi:hypothetical protein
MVMAMDGGGKEFNERNVMIAVVESMYTLKSVCYYFVP